MIIKTPWKTRRIRIDKEVIEQFHKFKYLGMTINEERDILDVVNERINKAERLYNATNTPFLNRKG